MKTERFAVGALAAAVEGFDAGVVERIEMQSVDRTDGLFTAVDLLCEIICERVRKVQMYVIVLCRCDRPDHSSVVGRKLTRKREAATPLPSSSSRTKPSTKEAGCGCQATVIELFSALHSSARIRGAPGAASKEKKNYSPVK